MSSPAAPPHPSPVETNPEPPIGALFSAASEHISTLIRGEVELAKTELTSSAKRGAIGAGMFGAAGVLLLFSVTFLFVAIAEALVAFGLPRWIAYLIVWAFFVLLAGALVFIGIRLLKKIKAPERTIETLKDSKELLSREPPGQRVAGFASTQ